MSIKEILGITLFDKKLNKVILLDILWHIGTGISTAFFSIYAQQSMEIAIVTITVITAASSLLRVLVSKFFGRMADKYSWAKMLSVCFLIGAVSFLIFAFANPGNCFTLNIFGSNIKINIFYILYVLLHAVSTAGTNSGMTNITFDYVSHENRRYALGIKSAIGGLVAFLATFAVRFFVNAYSEGVFTLLGTKIYAQQILSFGTALIFLFIVVYIKKVIMKLKIVED
jgi:MFS family permease